MNTLDRIKKLAAEQFELRDDVLISEATFEGLGLDSLDRIEFMFALEDEFKIKIPERDVKITTVQDLANLIDKLVSEQHTDQNVLREGS